MFKKILITILIFTAAAAAQEFGKLEGKVTDSKTNSPVLGANLYLEGTSLGAATIGGGKYLIKNIPPDKYNLKVSMLGYRDVVIRDIKIESGKTVNMDVELNSNTWTTFSGDTETLYRQQLNKELLEKLEQIKQKNQNKYQTLLREAYFKNSRFPHWERRNKEQFERQQKILDLEIQSESLALDYKDTDGNKKQSVKKELQKVLSELFELREKDRKEDVARLEKELQELKESLQIRANKKNEIIERRIEDLLGENKYLDWD
jgi:hypothetical protein